MAVVIVSLKELQRFLCFLFFGVKPYKVSTRTVLLSFFH